MAKKATKKASAEKAVSAVAEMPPKDESVTVSGTNEQSGNQPAGPTPEQQTAIDAALKKIEEEAKANARKAVDTILGGNAAAGLGTPSGNVEERQEHVQADRLPGSRRKDKTYVPEWVYDDRTGERRKVLDYNRFRYCMIPEDNFASYTGDLWKFVKFDGGQQSGLLGDGWQGTGDAVFMRDIRGYCRRGDVYLMYIELRRYQEIIEDDRLAAERALKAPVGHFADVAYDKGIRPRATVNYGDGEENLL